MLKLMFGEMAEETLLASTKVLPHKLQMEQFRFSHPDLQTALGHILHKE